MHSLTRLFVLACLVWLPCSLLAADPQPLRLGVLKFGTVNWELDVIRHHRLDHKYGIDLQITPLGGKNATHVALQGGAVDVIVSDWLWVTRQRDLGRDYTFAPYSNAVGSLMVNPDAGIKSLKDLTYRKLGIAGGALDKTWLLLRAYSRKQIEQDLAGIVEPTFGAPPLLNQLALRGDLDALINFWHYAARLEARGFKTLIDMPQILSGLGIERPVPLIGWVFSEQWAADNRQAMLALLQASLEAKTILSKDDGEWNRLRPRMKAEDEQVFIALREGFRAGIPTCFGSPEIAAARDTFAILAEVGGRPLTGDSASLNNGTFWPGFEMEACPR